MTKTRKLFKWDAADYLKSQEDISNYLREAFSSNDPQHIAGAIGDVLRANRQFSRVARETNLNRIGLTHSLSDQGDPKLSTLLRVMDNLGYTLTPTQKQAGYSFA